MSFSVSAHWIIFCTFSEVSVSSFPSRSRLEIHRFQEFRKVSVALEYFLVGDNLRNLHREYEAFRRSCRSIANRLNRRVGIKRRVKLDSMEVLGVESQVIRGAHSFG